MRKKILVLTGSARKHGNSILMAEAFIKGAEAAGHTVVRYDAALKNLRGCIYCGTCYSQGENRACTPDPSFDELAPHFQDSDLLVLATPLYWYTFPAQIKAALDQYFSLMIGKKRQNIKEAMLLVCGTGKDDWKYAGILQSFSCILKDRKWEDKGHYIVSGVAKEGDVTTEHLQNIEALGIDA